MSQPTPWRIAAQSYVVLDPDTREPAFTLQFIVDHQQADVAKLRMVPDGDGAALEMEFNTGGYVLGQPVKQPRWLKAFERPDPNLYLDDDKAAEEYHASLSPEQQQSYVARRDGYLARRKEWEKVHPRGEPQQVGSDRGPDSTDPNSVEAERARSAKSGVDVTQPADADRKGMASQSPGGQAGDAAAQSGAQEPNAPNAVDQQLQKQGQVDTGRAKTLEELNTAEHQRQVDVGVEKVQGAVAG